MPHPSDATLKSITMDSEGLESWDYCLSHFRKRGLVWQPGNITYFMRQIFSDVTFGGSRVLDIGGGAGLASYYAACMGAESVLCLEPGASGSNACATGVPFFDPSQDRLSRVRFSKMTLQEYLTSPPNHFELVITLASINHLDEPACIAMNTPAGRDIYLGLLGGVRGLMKPGGQLVVMDCFRWNALEFFGFPHPLRKQIEREKHWQPATWVELIEQCGFKMESLRYLSLNSLREPGSWLMNNWLAAICGSGDFCIRFRVR